MVFISNLKEKGSNLPPSVHNVLIWLVCLFSRSFTKEARNSPTLIKDEAFGMHSEENRGSISPGSKRKLKKTVHGHAAGEHDRATVAKAAPGRACARSLAHGWPCVWDTVVHRLPSRYWSDFSASFRGILFLLFESTFPLIFSGF